MTIDANGHSITTMNGAQTADFEAYAVDIGEKGDGQGLYVAWSNLTFEAEAAPYSMTERDDGQFVLTLTADDGVISRVRQDTETASDAIEIDSVEKLAAIDANPSGHHILTADIDLAGMDWTPIGAFVMGGGRHVRRRPLCLSS